MKKLFLCVLWICCAVYVAAQVQLTAQTDKTDLALDDEITLTVQVSGISGNIVMPQLPSLPAFNVFSRGMAQSTVNGHTSLTFRYMMIPRVVGRTTIGPVTFNYGGQKYQTEPIEVRIYKSAVPANAQTAAAQTAQTAAANTPKTRRAKTANAAKAANTELPPFEQALAAQAAAHQEPYFIVAAVSNNFPYVGQSATLAVRFYYAAGFYEAAYENPTVSNLLLEDNGRTQGRRTIHGKVYNYEEKRYTLSGVSAGKASVGPASVTYRTASTGDSLFDRFFGGAVVSKPVTVSSDPIALSIRPLPPGQPDSFYGAVGTGFHLTSRLDKPQTEAGDAVTLTVTVQGPENLKTTSDLAFPQFAGFTSYPAAAETGTTTKKQHYKTFKTVLVPQASGTYTLEGIDWSYFDPVSDTYKTLTTRPLSLQVTPSSNPERKLDFGSTALLGNGIQTLQQDIRYVKNAADAQLSFLDHVPAWKWLHIAAFGWLAVCLFIAGIGKKTKAKKHAYQHAKAQLKKARSYEDISDALADYLRLKWNISAASLPLKDMLSALAQHGASAESQRTFAALWKELESARFAPVSAQENLLASLAARAAELLKMWEKHA